MKIPYFPGCTLYNKAQGLDNSTRASLAALGVELAVLPQWTCCGTVFPLAGDNYMQVVEFPCKTACCGSYQLLYDGVLVRQRVQKIVSSAAILGAEAIITSCPLCHFNLDWLQEKCSGKITPFVKSPFYISPSFWGLPWNFPAKALDWSGIM